MENHTRETEAEAGESLAERGHPQPAVGLELFHERDLEERDEEPVQAHEQAVGQRGVAGGGDGPRHHADVGKEEQREGKRHRGHLQVDPVPEGAFGRRGETRSGRPLPRLRPRLGDEEVNNQAVEERGEPVPEEQEPPAPVREESADGHPHRETQVHGHAQGGEAGHAVGGGQQVTDDRGGGRPVEVGHEPEEYEQGDKDPHGGRESQAHGQDPAAEKTHHQGPAAPEAVGQETSRQDGDDGARPVGGEQLRHLGLPQVELAKEHDGEKGHDEGARPVDEGAGDEEAHGTRKAGEELQGAREHGSTLAAAP